VRNFVYVTDDRVSREVFVHAVAAEIQVAIGAAPYASVDELIDIFNALAERIPQPKTEVDRMVLRRLLAQVTRHVYEHAGAERPLRPVVTQVADADDPLAEFKVVLAALAERQSRRGGATRT
jgi:hypothetical protein